MTSPTRYTARTPDDLLALVPVVLGFVPDQSVVMLTFAAPPAGRDGPGAHPFHARINLPDAGVARQVDEVVAGLLDPVLRHRLARVAFVLYTDDAGTAARVTEALCARFAAAGIEVLEVLRADGRHWFPMLPGRPPLTYQGIAYDVSAHPFRVRSVLDGQVTHASRAELAATLAPGQVLGSAALAPALAAIERLGEPGQLAAEAAWLRATLRRRLEKRSSPDDAEAARILAAVREIELRDVAWSLMDRAVAPRHVELWSDLLRRAPEALAAPAGGLLAFAAWLAGHGALAWCAVDRCAEVEPGYRLAGYVAQALTHAVPPSVWQPPAADELTAFDPA